MDKDWCLKEDLTLEIMTKEEFLKSKLFKIALPIFIIALIIALYRNGYAFGQWLHQVLN